jgi:hypothetical protein
MRWPWDKPNPLAGKDFMQLVPVPVVEHRRDDDGGVTLLPPRFPSGLGARWLQPRLPAARRHVRVRLEERGAMLWEQMDGRRPVHELVRAFEEAFPDDRENAVDRVCRWVGGVYRHGFVRFRGIEP